MTEKTQAEMLAELREPFRPEEIRYVSRVWCKACKESRAGCQHHQVVRCEKCKSKRITTAHVDLAYVGHAEATNRLLNVDPLWSWEPLSLDGNGLPQYDGNRGLWIRLTVGGITRLGYGNAEGKSGGDAVKEIIGDAIRNAGMRFGMALDLWTSSDLEIAGGEEQAPESEPVYSQQAQDVADVALQTKSRGVVQGLYRTAREKGQLEKLVKIEGSPVELGSFLISWGKELPPEEPKPEKADHVQESQDRHEEAVESMDHTKAVMALREFAKERGIDDIEGDAYKALGVPLEEANAMTIWALLNSLQKTA